MSYMLSTDPTDAKSWSYDWPLWKIRPPAFPIYSTLIGDSTTMYLFWIDYYVSKMFRSSMPNEFFPRNFSYQADILMENFEENVRLGGVQAYTLKDRTQYLMIVEVIGSKGRFYWCSTATSLDVSWLPQATSDNGDIIRSNQDQTFTIDGCNLQFLYQDDLKSYAYGAIYRPGLLTLNTTTVAPVTSTTMKTKSEAKTVTATTTTTIKETIIRITTKPIVIKTKTAFVTQTKKTTETTTKAITKTMTRIATKTITRSAFRTTTNFVPFTVRTTITPIPIATTNKRAPKLKHTASRLV